MPESRDIRFCGADSESEPRTRAAGEPDPRGGARVIVTGWDASATVMTTRRLELLRHLRHRPEPSIAALARALRRDYKRVHEDVEVLVRAGLLDRDDAGLRVDYDEIRTTIVL